MPEQERTRLRQLIAAQEWATADYARLQQAARKGDGYLAAFLYALDGDPAHAPIAQKWLLGQFGKNSGKVNGARGALNNPDYFKGGMPHLGSVYYDTDFTGYAAFDWAYNGLEPAARQEISDGIVLAARYKMRCMDRWWQTPNLMFKPTSTVAVAGLATQDKEAIEWGFRRPGRTFDSADLTPGSHGGYFRVLNAMLKDGGVWHESTTYAISHQDLYCMTMVSRFLSLAEDQDWWRQKMGSGGSAAGLMDYYIDSAYPIERTGYGPGQIRVATYGDGATHAGGDLYLVNPAEGGLNATEALIASYQTSHGDPRLAPFMAMIPDYKPTLIDRWPVPEKVAFPPAPSKVWPTYGLAMLRADESPAYWTNDSLAVFHIMGHGYSHDHRDKFAIMLHGAGRLLYPDHNTIQYENPYIGWTRNTIGHCTLMVDEKDTRNAPTTARHEFSPEVKFLASSASGIFEAVDQTRALLLTREYLLDLFQAGSPTPRTFDYLLHSFGKPQPAQPEQFKPSTALDKRYWLVSDRQAMNTDAPWTLDFVITNAPGDRKVKFGPEWYEHKAAVRVTMAAEPKTLLTHGLSGIELAKQQKRAFETLGMLIVRRADVRQTVFAATHEPYANEARPRISAVTKLAQTDSAILVRVDAADFTDYAAVAFGPQPPGTPEHVLTATGDSKTRVAFKNYGYLRVRKDGPAAARGGWTALSLPDVKGTLTLNGQPTTAGVAGGYLTFGTMPAGAQAAPAVVDCPFPITCTPDIIRLAREGRRTMTLTLKNTLPQAVSGSLAMNLPAGVTTDPAAPQFGPVQPGATVQVPVTFVAAKDAVRGKRLVPCRVSYRPAKDGPEVRTGALPLHIAVDPSLESVYQYPQKNVFLVSAPHYTLKLHMRHGLPLYLADDDGTVRLEDGELFTISNKDKPVLSASTADGFTWPEEAPAGLVAHMGELRYCVKLTGDRVILSMDRDYTTFDPARITIPGKWISPEGAPTWKRIVAVDASGQEVQAKPGTELKIAAAELAFPGAKWNLAFGFNPPQPVTFNGTELTFPIGSYSGDACSAGFCKPGELDAWRKGSSSE